MSLIRFDSARLKARFDDNGYLHDEPVVARVGILHYRNADGSPRRELRLPEDVFRADSLEAFAGMPITVGHKAMVNSKNHRELSVGTCLGAARQDGENVRAPVVVQDNDTVMLAKSGAIAGLSVGYRIDYEPRPGMYNTETGEVKYNDERDDAKGTQEFVGKEWQHFDGLQRNIRPNHLALVKHGRAGTIARLNLDGSEEIDYHSDELNKPENKTMTLIRLDSGAEVEVEQAVADAFTDARAKLTKETARADSAQEQVSTLTAERDLLKEQADAHAQQLEQARADAAEQVKTRTELEATAKKFGVDVRADMADIDVKKAVVLKASPAVNFEGKDAAYVDARFDAAVESGPATGSASLAAQRLSVMGKLPAAGERNDSAEASNASEARAAMINKMKGGN